MLHSIGSQNGRHHPSGPPGAIIIVDRHILVRTCILKVLRTELVGTDVIDVSSTEELPRALRRDVRLVALNIHDRAIDDPSVRLDLDTINEVFPDAPVAILSHRDDDETVMKALHLGVSGFFPPSVPVDIAIAGVRLVLAGGVYCPRHVGAAVWERSGVKHGSGVIEHAPRSRTPSLIQVTGEELTPREEQVLSELQCGRSNKAIAAQLKMSENTVKMHIQHIMRKLQARNRTEAVFLWQRRMSGNVTDPIRSAKTVHAH